MAEDSNIGWTDHTINLFWGCAKVHTGCKNCYAEALSDTRLDNNLWGDDSPRKRIKSAFKDLDKFQVKAFKANKKVKVFCGSMMDIFEDNKILENPYLDYTDTSSLRNELFTRINNGRYDNIIFLFLTKRPSNILFTIPVEWASEPPKNVWFGTSLSNQETADRYVDELKALPNNNLFLSIEPQVDLIDNINLNRIAWVIQGGESGLNKREFKIEWAERIKDICESYRVPYFFKQIDGKQEIPTHLQIQNFPNFN